MNDFSSQYQMITMSIDLSQLAYPHSSHSKLISSVISSNLMNGLSIETYDYELLAFF